jgi:opacity protein-like surface antigen
MKRTALIALAALFLLSATAFADDGFKAYVGYSIGYQEHKDTYNGGYEPPRTPARCTDPT